MKPQTTNVPQKCATVTRQTSANKVTIIIHSKYEKKTFIHKLFSQHN